MAHRFGILVFPNVQQLDLTGPYEVFASAPGAEIHLLWKDRAPLLSSTGLALTPTTTLEECPPLDVFCIPGGIGINTLLHDETVLDFVRAQAWAAASQAASAHTMVLPLPPSSSATRLSPLARLMASPTLPEPVKEMKRTPGSLTNWAPAS